MGRTLLALIALGFIARIIITLVGFGSNDMRTWHEFANTITGNGLLYMYQNVPGFNHPPLMGYYAASILHLSQAWGIDFYILFKLPMVMVDGALTCLIFVIRTKTKGSRDAMFAAAFYALNLTAILVSAYHGNTDTFCAAGWLLSAWLLMISHDFSAGLALAAAINVKLIPVLAIPVMLAGYTQRRRAIRFVAGLSCGVIPFVPVLWSAFDGFISNALKYNSVLEFWGFELLALQSMEGGLVLRPIATKFSLFYYENGRYMIFITIGAAAIWARYLSRHTLASAVMVPAIFLVFTPGWGAQYMIYMAPLLAAWQPTEGLRYGSLAGLFIGLTYLSFWTGGIPAFSFFITRVPMPAQLIGFLTWLYLIQLVWKTMSIPLREASSRRIYGKTGVGTECD